MTYQIHQLLNRVVDFILPPRCVNCGSAGAILCADCLRLVSFIEEPICEVCGEPLRTKGLCVRCQEKALSVYKIRAAVYFRDPIPNIIHQFKYHNVFALADILSDLMYQQWFKWFAKIDMIIPIPLHKKRLQERGYNQSTLLARPLARKVKVDFNESVLKRVNYTQPQAQLNALEREENVRNAFEVTHKKMVLDKHILLVDDVCTTGATLNAAAQTLLSCGAGYVSAYCLSRASNKRLNA